MNVQNKIRIAAGLAALVLCMCGVVEAQYGRRRRRPASPSRRRASRGPRRLRPR